MDGDHRLSVTTRLQALADEVERLRDRFDADRRLPDEIITALVKADLFRLTVPLRYGGAELGLRDLLEIIETACALDASVAWVLTNGAVMSRLAGFLPDEAVSALFATPDCMMAGSTAAVGRAVPADGGFRVAGIWPFASGIHAARHVAGLCEVADQSNPALRMMILPVEAVEIRDDWFSSGLRGSGSCTFSATDVFVPASFTVPFMAHRPVIASDPYHLPHLSIFPLSVTMVALGIVQAALADFALLANRTRGGTSTKLADRELIQTDLGRAMTLHRAARAVVLDTLTELEAAFADPTGDRTLPRAFFRASLAQAGELCERAMALICTALGTTSVLETYWLERRQRDLSAAVKHVAMGPQNLTVLGRVQLGLDPGTLRF